MLCSYHFKLMRKGLTTHEDCKYVYEDGQGSPFSMFSYFANLKRTVFKKFGKKLFNPELMYKPKESVQEEAVNQANKKDNRPDTKRNDPVESNNIQLVVADKKLNERVS
eukprot:TRINITY_DN7039_c0_g1_i1.p2 TRINITY_DN7039_c0_g1~~TRINITY_DN7039_c0_g1_i1.p2  ORF type:complete len:109 (-),score=16.66 TRINITY_DN7039_c0_g1_i1:165-491(-)